MTAPLTPAQLDAIRNATWTPAEVSVSRVGASRYIQHLAGLLAVLLAEVDRLRDYADTIDATNADLVTANEVHRQRLRDVLAECDRADANPGLDGERKVHTVVIRQAVTPRPLECCGKCPPIVGGGYDCTCDGNPRCTNP